MAGALRYFVECSGESRGASDGTQLPQHLLRRYARRHTAGPMHTGGVAVQRRTHGLPVEDGDRAADAGTEHVGRAAQARARPDAGGGRCAWCRAPSSADTTVTGCIRSAPTCPRKLVGSENTPICRSTVARS